TAESTGERVKEIEAGTGSRNLGGVDIAVHPESRLLGIRSGREGGDGDEPDISSLVALPNALNTNQTWILLAVCAENIGEVIIPVEDIKPNGRHCFILCAGERRPAPL